MLIDSHCHLDRVNLSHHNDSLADMLSDAQNSGVERFLCVCISEENKDTVVNIAEQFDSVYASVGVHPCDVKESLVTESQLSEWAAHTKVVALGETGLDYYYGKETLELQQESFSRHLKTAARLELPVIVHTRDAREDTLKLIAENGSTRSAGVLHCFTETWEMAKAAIDMNYYISLSGIVTFKNATELRDVAKKIPMERLLVETDSPYLAPMPFRGKPNQPKYVKQVAEFVADLKGVSYEQLLEVTAENFFNCFSKAR